MLISIRCSLLHWNSDVRMNEPWAWDNEEEHLIKVEGPEIKI